MNRSSLLKSLYICCLFTLPLIAANSSSAFVSLDQGSKVTFKEPVPLSKIKDAVKKNGVEITELYYQQGDIQGGYTIQSGVDIDAALADFEKQHREFITKFSADTENLVNDKSTGSVDKQRNIEMLNEIKFADSETKSKGLEISSFETKTKKGLDALQAMGNIEHVEKIEKLSDKVALVVNKTLAQINPINVAAAVETWAPNRGTSDVARTYTKQTFYFPNVTAFGSSDTYEHETQVYNSNFANYGNYWSSNLPYAYKDTQFLDTLDNFTVGTSKASALVRDKQYYTHMSLTAGSASSATVRIKGQKGKRTPSSCYSTWCIFATATTGSLATHTAPSGLSWIYR